MTHKWLTVVREGCATSVMFGCADFPSDLDCLRAAVDTVDDGEAATCAITIYDSPESPVSGTTKTKGRTYRVIEEIYACTQHSHDPMDSPVSPRCPGTTLRAGHTRVASIGRGAL